MFHHCLPAKAKISKKAFWFQGDIQFLHWQDLGYFGPPTYYPCSTFLKEFLCFYWVKSANHFSMPPKMKCYMFLYLKWLQKYSSSKFECHCFLYNYRNFIDLKLWWPKTWQLFEAQENIIQLYRLEMAPLLNKYY